MLITFPSAEGAFPPNFPLGAITSPEIRPKWFKAKYTNCSVNQILYELLISVVILIDTKNNKVNQYQ